MKYDAKNLKINSMLIMILSVLSVIVFAAKFMTGENRFENVREIYGWSGQSAFIAYIVAIVFSVLLYLLEFYIGFKGLRQADGKCKGRSNIILAKIMLVMNSLAVIISICGLATGKDDVQYLCQSLIYVSVYYAYIRSAKAISQ